MKCKKCNHKNVSQARYCFKCGNMFTKEEREKELNKSFVTKYKKIKEWYDKLTLSKITSHIAFKILTVLIVLFIGIYSVYKDGVKLKVIDGENYTYKYNSKLDEYYLYLNTEESNLNLYLPKKVDKFYVSYYNAKDELLNENTYDNLSDIKINVDNVSNYYKVSLDETGKDSIKLYVLGSEGISNE